MDLPVQIIWTQSLFNGVVKEKTKENVRLNRCDLEDGGSGPGPVLAGS